MLAAAAMCVQLKSFQVKLEGNVTHSGHFEGVAATFGKMK